MEITLKTFEELTREELYALLKLRSDVFIFEQESVYADIDGQDPKAIHVLAFDGSLIIGVARLLPLPSEQKVELGRVVVSEEYRRKGIASRLIDMALQTCEKNFPNWDIWTSAQQNLQEFYQSFGFEAAGDVFTYPKDQIPHVPMKRVSGK